MNLYETMSILHAITSQHVIFCSTECFQKFHTIVSASVHVTFVLLLVKMQMVSVNSIHTSISIDHNKVVLAYRSIDWNTELKVTVCRNVLAPRPITIGEHVHVEASISFLFLAFHHKFRWNFNLYSLWLSFWFRIASRHFRKKFFLGFDCSWSNL